MASHNILLASLIALAMLCKSRADLINDVCAQSQNPSSCTLTLRADPRSKLLQTYKLLAEISIDRTQSQSIAVARVAKSVEDGRNKAATEGCVVALNLATGSLEQAKGLLKLVNDKNTQRTLDVKVLEAWASSIGCDARFADVPQPPELKKYNNDFLDLISVIRVIVSKLV